MRPKTAPKYYIGAVFFLSWLIYILACWPALSGGFVLDDWPNLSGLESVRNWHDIWLYTFSGTSGPLGRPVSYFSFAIQAADWPNNPLPFKLFNLIIHSANAFLCYIACYLFARHAAFNESRANMFASFCAFLWLVSPLHASTVFYVVQRMVLLSGLFTWIGIVGFLLSALIASEGKETKGRWLATVSVSLAYVLGVLSKENGVLLGVFIATCYFAVIRNGMKTNRLWWDGWIAIFALLPVAITAVYLLWGGRYLGSYSSREFNVEQRLFSEWRILWEYVSKIILPTPEKINLFNDGFVFSKGLMNPITTLLSGLSWLLLFILSFIVRKKLPFVLFGVAWFWGGHLLESTALGLELYFEHRNYMPSVGVFVAFVWAGFVFWDWASKLQSRATVKIVQTTLLSVVGIYFLWSMATLSVEAMSWKDKKSFVLAAVTDRPQSLRAHQEAASFMAMEGDYLGSASLLRNIDSRWPDYPGTYAWIMYLHCLDSRVVAPTDVELNHRFKYGRFDRGTSNALFDIYELKRKGSCDPISWDKFRKLLHVVMSNPNFPKFGMNDNLFRLEVLSYIEQRNLKAVNVLFEGRDEARMTLSLLKMKMQMLSLAGRERDALALIKRIKDRFKGEKKLWIVNRHYFLKVEQKIKSNLDPVGGD